MHVSEVLYGFLYRAIDLQSVTHESMNLKLSGWLMALWMNYGSTTEWEVFYESKMAECYSSSSESCMAAALLGPLPQLFFLGQTLSSSPSELLEQPLDVSLTFCFLPLSFL